MDIQTDSLDLVSICNNSQEELLQNLSKIINFSGFHRSHPADFALLVRYTNFLPTSAKLKQRIWHLTNGASIPICKCGKTVKWHHVKQSYNESCSTKCANNNHTKITKIKTIIRDKYGTTSYAQSFVNLDSLQLIQDREWLYDAHITQEKSLAQIAKELDIDTSTVSNYCRRFDIKVKLFPKSGAEQEILNFLSTKYSDRIDTNTKSIIYPLELDIYLPNINLAIEYCGLYWHCLKHTRITPQYHKIKYDKCKQLNIRLITIFEDEWLYNQNIVKQKLLSVLQLDDNPVVFARMCSTNVIDKNTKTKFFNEHHIQGNGPGSINIGLEHNNELVACMSFIKQQNGVFVLNRYSTSVRVPGGFSKLLSYFKKHYEWNEIISFADLRWSQGKLYEKNGFALDKILPPDYKYVDLKNMIRIHKFNFRHKNLPNMLGENYNPVLSETENTTNNSWYKIYNCGLLRYILRK
ncbi:MAG: hypothetical protein ACXW2E_00165 [Nitrososphaeraceae archaeon]